jgi:8-oxo-dGTP diphosphatase
MNPRFGTPPAPARRYKRRPGAYVVLLREGQMLVTRQYVPDLMAAPEIQLPGGGIDPGESPIPALHREVYEETGWRMGQPRRLGAFRRFTYMPEYDLWAEKLCTIYVARPTVRIGPPLEPGHQAIWMPAGDAIAALDNDGDRFFAQSVVI